MKRIRVQLDEKRHKRLETLATRIMRSPSWIVSFILDGWMAGDGPELLAGSIRGNRLENLPAPVRATARARQKIVEGWIRATVMRRGRGKDTITDEYLARQRAGGERVSRATLYKWTRRYTRRGLPGLVDGRTLHQPIIERDSKGDTSTGATPVRAGAADCLTTPTRAASVTARTRRTEKREDA